MEIQSEIQYIQVCNYHHVVQKEASPSDQQLGDHDS